LSIRVSDAANEEPIFQAEVQVLAFARGVYTFRGYTDGGGRVSFLGVRRGSYQLEVIKDGYETTRQTIDIGYAPNENVSVSLRRRPGTGTKTPPAGTVSAATPAEARREYEEGVGKLKQSPAESAEHFRKAIEMYPDYAEAHAMLGLALMRQKKNADAAAAFSRAIKINPKLAFAYTLLGKIYLEEKKFDQAEPLLVKGTELDPQAWDAHFELARYYFNTAKMDKALAAARRAHDLPQAASSTHLLLVDIYLRKGDDKAALRELQEFEKADPNSGFMPRVRQMIERLSKKG
jgi:tetratricopeptide (TPR) repeat protein